MQNNFKKHSSYVLVIWNLLTKNLHHFQCQYPCRHHSFYSNSTKHSKWRPNHAPMRFQTRGVGTTLYKTDFVWNFTREIKAFRHSSNYSVSLTILRRTSERKFYCKIPLLIALPSILNITVHRFATLPWHSPNQSVNKSLKSSCPPTALDRFDKQITAMAQYDTWIPNSAYGI